MATPHNEASFDEIARIVLMPGDPLRAKYIAEHYLSEAVCFNTVRNMLGYTGYYKGKKISVMGSGMGMASIGIYSYDLFHDYDVEYILRIGSAGAYSDELQLFDMVLAESAWSESTYAKAQGGETSDVLYPSLKMNACIRKNADKLGKPLHIHRIHSSDVFYCEDNVDDYIEINRKHHCTCVDMESFALFHNASVLGRKAACLLTISDSFPLGEKASPEERQTAFTDMMKVALEACL